MTALRFPHFAPAPAGRPIRRIPVARRVERRVAWRMEPRRHETGGAIPRLLRLGRDLLLALWAVASLGLWIVLLAGLVL